MVEQRISVVEASRRDWAVEAMRLQVELDAAVEQLDQVGQLVAGVPGVDPMATVLSNVTTALQWIVLRSDDAYRELWQRRGLLPPAAAGELDQAANGFDASKSNRDDSWDEGWHAALDFASRSLRRRAAELRGGTSNG